MILVRDDWSCFSYIFDRTGVFIVILKTIYLFDFKPGIYLTLIRLLFYAVLIQICAQRY